MPELPDPRNAAILVYVGDRLYPREEAKVSVFDSSVQGGDTVWEGLRVYQGRIFKLEEHLDRLIDSAKAMAFDHIPSKEEIKEAIFRTLQANGMKDGVHIRLTLSRGLKVTSNMDPRVNQYGPCLIVLAEWKKPTFNPAGIRLITSAVRRNTPQCIDSKIHHGNLINNILAKIEASAAGADEALMLDIHGFVSETNSANVFVIKSGELLTPHTDSCLPGITRKVVIELAQKEGYPIIERNISLSEVYSADEMFCTGTVGEITPILEVDGRRLGLGKPGSITQHLRDIYADYKSKSGEPLPF
jgi:branched-chain amino acid aminotransferase group I